MAAASVGENGGLFQKHRRWRSENVEDEYIYEEIQTKLSVPKDWNRDPTLKNKQLHYHKILSFTVWAIKRKVIFVWHRNKKINLLNSLICILLSRNRVRLLKRDYT